MMTIGYGDVRIPLHLTSSGGDLGGILPIISDDPEISISLDYCDRGFNFSSVMIPVVLKEDHAPSLKIEPDPYLDPYNEADRRLTLSSGRGFANPSSIVSWTPSKCDPPRGVVA